MCGICGVLNLHGQPLDVAVGQSGVYRIFRDTLRDAWFVEGELD